MKRAIGKEAENLAANYLVKVGYQIIERNYQIRNGEIDLIAMDQNTLVIVEVRSGNSPNHVDPLESITPFKIKRICRATRHYLKGKEIAVRFDVIIIKDKKINHLKSAFDYCL